MARVIVFANNQTMAADAGTSSTITTDPVPLLGDDRASFILLAHYFFGGGGARTFVVRPQVSNDGTTWVDVGADTTIDDVADTPLQTIATVIGAYLRYRFTLTSAAASPIAQICFDLHAVLDHV